MADGGQVGASQAQGQLTDSDRAFAAISYILGILVAAAICLVKKENRFVRFHAMQAVLADIAIAIISFVIVILAIAAAIIGVVTKNVAAFLAFPAFYLAIFAFSLLILAVRLFLAWKAYRGEGLRIPLLGGLAERFSAT
jgi:uncharacterized membrane protein